MKVVKTILQNISKSFRHNMGLKLLSLLFALILWNYVVSQTNPNRTVKLSNVPVRFVGMTTLQNQNLALSKATNDYLSDMTVTVEDVPANNVSQVTNDTVALTVDLSSITSPGEHTLKVAWSTQYGKVKRMSSETVTVEVEQLVSRTLPIKCRFGGAFPTGFSPGTVNLEPSVVKITGPQTVVEQVESAYVTLPVGADTRGDVLESLMIELEDASGNEVPTTLLTLTSSDSLVSVPVSRVKTLEVTVEGAILGQDQLPQGYEVAGIEVTPQEVELSGSAEVLEDMTSVTVESIDVAGASSDVHAETVLVLPDGVTATEGSAVEVIIRIAKVPATVEFQNVPVTLTGTPEGLTPTASTLTCTVKVTGPELDLAKLTADQLTVTADLKGLPAGSHGVPLTVRLDDAYAEATAETDPATISVALTAS